MAVPRRKSPRLKNYDYTLPGSYFVTICTHHRQPILGEIRRYRMILNEAGLVAQKTWDALPERFSNISLDARVIMPNHVHGIILIDHQGDTGLTELITWYKYQTTLQINQLRGCVSEPVWQRSYYDHIIRDNESIALIRDYILGNPAKWAEDEYNRV